jgi:hypothetical protein
MSSLVQGSQQTPNSQRPMGIDYVRSYESGVVVLPGSFRGFTTASANYDARQTRGNYFSVTLVSTGRYRVTLSGIVPQLVYSSVSPTQAQGTTAVPGWPPGLAVNPQAFLTNDATPANLPAYISDLGAQVDRFSTIYATPFSATTNSFDIVCCNTGVLPSTVADVSALDRVNFQLAFKTNGYTP